jgi:CRP/FNR family cyclic AMP-dependent transcriptional regulator
MQSSTSGPCETVSDKTDTLQTRVRILNDSRLFAGLPADVLEALALAMKRRQAAASEAIFLQTDEGSALFAVLAGQVRIVIGGTDGREHVLRVLGPGEMFGEIAVLDGRPRSADAIAGTKCRLLLLERRSLLALIAAQPAVALGLIEILCERLRDTTTQVEGLLFHTLSERLASALLALHKDKMSASINVTQTELGHLTGVTRESVNKKLRAWQAAGLVELQPGRVRIVDADGLKQLLPPSVPMMMRHRPTGNPFEGIGQTSSGLPHIKNRNTLTAFDIEKEEGRTPDERT